jgi:hypothetical protein
MPQLAVAAVGAMIGGAAISGTVMGLSGAAIGWTVGSIVGGMLFAPDGPKAQLQDTRAAKLQHGAKKPRVYGTIRVPVSPRWQSEWRAAENEAGGKGGGGGATFYTYSCDLLGWVADVAGLPENVRIQGVVRIWVNNKLEWSAHPDADEETIEASANTDQWSSFEVFPGDEDQLPWSVYEAAVGAANADAHRREFCIGFTNLQTGTTAQLPFIEVEVTMEPTADLTPIVGFVSAAAGPMPVASMPNADDIEVGDLLLLVLHHNNPGETVSGAAGYTHIHSKSDSAARSIVKTYWRIADGTATDAAISANTSGSGLIEFVSIILRGVDTTNFAAVLGNLGSGYSVSNVMNPQPVTSSVGTSWVNLAIGFLSGGSVGPVPIIDTAPSGYTVADDIGLDIPGLYHLSMMVAYAQSPPQLTNITENPAEFAYDGYVHTGGTGTIFIRVPFATQTAGATGFVDLADVVAAECLRSGLTADDFDVSDLVGTEVRGFIANGSAREAIEHLMAWYYFECICGDKLYFRFRGTSSVATIAFEDSGAGLDQAAEPFCGVERANDWEMPAQVTAVAMNANADYEAVAATSDRGESTNSVRKEQFQLPIAATPAEAKGRANTYVLDARIASHTGEAALDDAYAHIECGDVVTMTDPDGNTYTMRNVREEYTRGVRKFGQVLNDNSVLQYSGLMSDTYEPSVNVALPAGPSMFLLDIPILRDADDDHGHYVAVDGDGTNWDGAVVYKSTDGGTSFSQIAASTNDAVTGSAGTVLGDWTGGNVFDEANSVTVTVSGTLTSSSRAAMLADRSVNAILVGDEILRFRTATLSATADGMSTYVLTGLLRGQRGTEWTMGLHEADERVVLLTIAALRRIDMDNAEVGLTRNYKGVTIGRLLSSAATEEFANNAVGKKPFSPTDLRIARNGSNDATLTWKRRTRLGSRLVGSAGISCPLGETTEEYEIDIYEDGTYTTIVREVTGLSSASYSYPAATQSGDGLTPGDPIYCRIYQISATVDRGYPLEAAA